jgi:hypothetical protein
MFLFLATLYHNVTAIKGQQERSRPPCDSVTPVTVGTLDGVPMHQRGVFTSSDRTIQAWSCLELDVRGTSVIGFLDQSSPLIGLGFRHLDGDMRLVQPHSLGQGASRTERLHGGRAPLRARVAFRQWRPHVSEAFYSAFGLGECVHQVAIVNDPPRSARQNGEVEASYQSSSLFGDCSHALSSTRFGRGNQDDRLRFCGDPDAEAATALIRGHEELAELHGASRMALQLSASGANGERWWLWSHLAKKARRSLRRGKSHFCIRWKFPVQGVPVRRGGNHG